MWYANNVNVSAAEYLLYSMCIGYVCVIVYWVCVCHFQASCDTLSADVAIMYNTLSQVQKVWTEFTGLASEVKGHLKRCESQLESVNLPGVSLDARFERYKVKMW